MVERVTGTTASQDIILSAVRQDNERVLVFRHPATGARAEIPLFSRDMNALMAWQAELPTKLVRFHEAAAAIEAQPASARWRQVSVAVRHLRAIALEFMGVLSTEPKALSRLEEFLDTIFAMNSDTRRTPTRIHLVFDEKDKDLRSLPLEYLPIPRSLGRSEIDSLTELQTAMNGFVGFAAVVIRRSVDDLSISHVLEACSSSKKIPVRIIANKKFYSNDSGRKVSEVLWLERRKRLLDTETPWPDATTVVDSAGERLARCLLDPRISIRGEVEDRGYRDQIQHVLSHYLVDDHALELRATGDELQEISVTRDALQGEFVRLNIDRAHPKREEQAPYGPFVFLNICAAGAVDPRGMLSFLEVLQRWTPARSLLAPATYVHFPLAAAFARRVYSELFKGSTLGDAVHIARWDGVLIEHNPFGILYGLHGDPDLIIGTSRA